MRPVILHADDDANDRLLVQIACARAGLSCNLRAVADGEEAISYVNGDGAYGDRAQHPFPDLLLLDLKLPRKSGFEVLEWIRSNSEMRNLPVIILSSSSHEKDVMEARELGATDFFTKPVSIRQLQEVMKEICHKWLNPGVLQ
ncbi:MAG TPA: response regulator [Verrucomicrobiae bacterium]|jgi:CheY-like chemotaxis protein|nr:response regulator [Verrucomicrobiae bacterium]